MQFNYNLGSFQEKVRVDGVDYTWEDFKDLPKGERDELAQGVFRLCAEANQAKVDEVANISAPIRGEYAEKRADLKNLPRFEKPYRGRAQEISREWTKLLRRQDVAIKAAVKNDVEPVDGWTYPAAVQNVFLVWESKLETKWERFERQVSGHDWYFAYSDDHRVWSAGNSQSERINSFVAQNGQKAKAIYNKHCPWLNDDGSKKESN